MAATGLSANQRAAFARDGYVVVPSVVNRTQVDDALQAITTGSMPATTPPNGQPTTPAPSHPG